jgi:predicted Holliday junction resolvase-like endonuclease
VTVSYLISGNDPRNSRDVTSFIYNLRKSCKDTRHLGSMDLYVIYEGLANDKIGDIQRFHVALPFLF